MLGQRISEIWSSLPELFILIVLSSMIEPSLFLMVFLMSIMGWVGLAAYVRAEFLRARGLAYVDSALALGSSSVRIMWTHVLPNAMVPITTFFPFRIAAAMVSLASLDFLGLGVPSPTPSLGELLAQGKANLHCWWIMAATFSVLVSMILSLNFVGEGVRRALDPHAH